MQRRFMSESYTKPSREHEPSTRDARPRIIAYFDEHLRWSADAVVPAQTAESTLQRNSVQPKERLVAGGDIVEATPRGQERLGHSIVD